ncbi:MAG: hypothetical protein RL264_447 [Bacteroidota bacterium]|jgi:spore coat polysaccharide biosynthesis protein SpsF (cytidylyltransferase family)
MTGILVLVRLGSKRLNDKHLIETENGSFLEVLLHRIKQEFQSEIKTKKVTVVIATSDEIQNEVLLQFNTLVYFGNKDNIPLRQLDCAKTFGFEKLISVDGDDILCAPEAMRVVYHALENGNPYVSTENYPIGMNVMGYSTSFLESCLKDKEESQLVTGWGRIFSERFVFKIGCAYAKFAHHRYTLDYPDDATFFKTVIEAIPDKELTTETIIKRTEAEGWYKINNHLSEEYMQNFNAEKNNEN